MSASDVNDSFDWTLRRSYDYLDALTHRDWSWEILRRHEDYQLSWLRSQSAFEIVPVDAKISIIRVHTEAPALTRWGCLYTDIPTADARSAKVFWQPARHSGVLHMHAIPASAGLQTGIFNIYDQLSSASLLLMPDGMQHLFLCGEGHRIQLAVSGASLLKSVHLLSDSVFGEHETRKHLETLHQFNSLIAGVHVPVLSAERHAARIKFILQALDGSLAGASHREIAVALFGPERVDADWNDQGQHLRDRVRRAINRGRALMNGGYLRFLR